MPNPQQTPDEVVALPTPPNTPGSYVTSKTDPSTLIQVGRSHAQVLASNLKSMMPVLIAYGYARDDLENLIEDCVGLVCRSERVGLLLMDSCLVPDLPSTRDYSQCTLPKSDKGIGQVGREEFGDSDIGHGQSTFQNYRGRRSSIYITALNHISIRHSFGLQGRISCMYAKRIEHSLRGKACSKHCMYSYSLSTLRH